MKIAAFFDIDGTLVSCQTQEQLANALFKNGLISRSFLIRIIFWYIAHKLSLVDNSLGLRRDTYCFLSKKEVSEIDRLMEKTFFENIKPKICVYFKKVVREHRDKGHDVYAISGTLEPLCRRVCEYFGITHYFATKLLIKDGRYTGEWKDEILEGRAKVNLVEKLAAQNAINLRESYAYADSYSDIPFLASVGHPVAVCPDRKLMHYAKTQKWEILTN